MPGQGREIRRRIKSIKSTRQVTRAMELVSAAKMRKAVANVLATRPYATLAWEMVQEIVGKTESYQHPLLGNAPAYRPREDTATSQEENTPPPFGRPLSRGESTQVPSLGRVAEVQGGSTSTKVALILISSNRGLAGSLNANIIAAAQKFVLAEKQSGKDVQLITMGKKGREAMAKRGIKIVADFEKADVHEEVEELRPVIKLAMDEFLSGAYEKVMIAYTDFVSALVQRPRIRQLLPIVQDADLGAVGQASHSAISLKALEPYSTTADHDEDGYIFEPSPARVLDMLLPRLVEVQLFQAVLESDASEHSARMFAMRNASDAANDMINELTLLYNQTRQAGITQEIAEISAGRIAIER